jgi:hypothetical protein
LEQLALAAHAAGQLWAAFWPTVADQVQRVEPYCRERYQRLVGRLLHLLLCGDDSGERPVGDDSEPWLADDDAESTTGSDHDTFAAYCRERWGFSRQRAYQFIQGALVAGEMSTIVDKPANEAQARELSRLPDAEQQAEVWQDAVKEAGGVEHVTAARCLRPMRPIRGLPRG